jgi:hypothetical protein
LHRLRFMVSNVNFSNILVTSVRSVLLKVEGVVPG